MNIIVDGENAIVGRLGSYVAKELLRGNFVEIVNSEKAIFSGNKEIVIKKVQDLRRMGRGGSMKGPKIPKVADRFLKRIIRGMLPWDRPRGRMAFKRLRCYTGNNIKEDNLKNIKKLNHKKPLRFFTIEKVLEYA